MALDEAGFPGASGSNTVHQSHVEQFKDEVIHLAQQQESRLRGCVRQEMVRGKTHNFERLGASAAVKKTTRHTSTPILDVPHSRRKLDMEDFLWADLVDEEDLIRMLIEPKSAYARNAAMAMGREWDSQIIIGMGADATDGDGNAVVFDDTNQRVGDGTAAMSIASLTDAKYILDKNEVPFNDRYMVVSAEEMKALLNTTEITSADYNTVRALVKGEIDTFMGFKFVQTELLPVVTTVRDCFAFQKDCVGLGIGRDVVTKVDQRKDVSYAWQIFAAFSAAATRIDDAGVVKVQTLVA
jgi:hypothetical protein